MNRLQRAAVLVTLVRALLRKGSWCGGTHIQKAAYFLQELLGVPLEFKFTLYKYGPYSFEFNDELAALRADDFLRLYIRDPQYGPRYFPGELSEKLDETFPKTIQRFERQISFVADTLGKCGVAELEKIATALYVRKTQPEVLEAKEAAKRLRTYKPHISEQAALAAVKEIDRICQEVDELLTVTANSM